MDHNQNNLDISEVNMNWNPSPPVVPRHVLVPIPYPVGPHESFGHIPYPVGPHEPFGHNPVRNYVISDDGDADADVLELIGCPNCMMYFMIVKKESQCPRCMSRRVIDFQGCFNKSTTIKTESN